MKLSACIPNPENRIPYLLFGAFILILGGGNAVFAQTNEEVFREFQFSFSPPGARANGMGSAFIGLADDASATYANPAGLAFLRDPAVTLEYSNNHIPRVTGEGSGPINFGYSQEPVSYDSVSFFSLNFRFGEWYFALFGHTFLEEQQARDFTARSLSEGLEQITTLNVSLNLTGKTYGIGVARRLGPLKVGATINQSTLQMKSNTHKQAISLFPLFTKHTFTSEIDQKERELSWSTGILWNPDTKISLGAVYKQNPQFNLTESIVEITEGQPISSDEVPVKFVVPDVYGAGLRYAPLPGINFLFDWQHIQYKQIIQDGFSIVENIETDRKEYYETKNVDEIHLGAEYLKPLEKGIFALRCGYYQNPNHLIRYKGTDPVQASLFSQNRGDEELHWTFGVGWSYRNRLELDLAWDQWGDHSTALLSILWRKK